MGFDISIVFTILIALQWTILVLFVLIYGLMGRKRGVHKTTYYFVVNTFLLFLPLILTSLLPLRMFITAETINKLNLFDDFVLGDDPSSEMLLQVILGFAQLAFNFVFYFISKLTIKPLLKHLIFKRIYVKRYETDEKRTSSNTLDSVGGLLVGSLRGVFHAVMLFMPLIVLVGTVNKFRPRNDVLISNSINDPHERINYYLSNESNYNNDFSNMDEMEIVVSVARGVRKVNNYGLGAITKRVKIKRSLDEVIFDTFFNFSLKQKGSKKVVIRPRSELEIAGALVDVYLYALDSGVGINNFKLDELNPLFVKEAAGFTIKTVGKSTMLQASFDIGLDFLYDSNILEESANITFNDNEYIELAFKELKGVKLEKEFNTLALIVEDLVEVGLKLSVDDNIESIKLTYEDVAALLKSLTKLSELNFYPLINIMLEVFLQQDNSLNFLEYVEVEERYEYVHNKLDFIFSDPLFFKKEAGKFYELVHDVIDEANDKNLKEVFIESEEFDFYKLISNDYVSVYTKLIDGLSELVLVNKLPVVFFEYYIHSNKEELGENYEVLLGSLDNLNIKTELNIISSIFTDLINIDIVSILDETNKENSNVFSILDDIFADNNKVLSIKNINSKLFDESQIINYVISIFEKDVLESVFNDQEHLVISILNDKEFTYKNEIDVLIDTFVSISTSPNTSLSELFDTTTNSGDSDPLEFLNILKDLDSERLFDSKIIYYLINNIILEFEEIKDHIPDVALDKPGLIKKSELIKIFEVLKKVSDFDNLKVKDVEEVVSIESVIVNKLITDQIISLLEIDESKLDDGIIKSSEILTVIETLYALGVNKEDKLFELELDLDFSLDNLEDVLDIIINNDSELILDIIGNVINDIDGIGEFFDEGELTKEELSDIIDDFKQLLPEGSSIFDIEFDDDMIDEIINGDFNSDLFNNIKDNYLNNDEE